MNLTSFNWVTFLKKSLFSRLDIMFISILFFISCISILNFYSLASSELSSLFWTQLGFLSLGWILFFILSFINYLFFIRWSWWIYGLNIVALLLVLFFGKTSHGSSRWLDLGLFFYQPSETVKVSLVLILSLLLSKKPFKHSYQNRDLILIFMAVLLPVILIFAQPDLGTAVLITLIFCFFLFFIKISHSLVISLITLIVLGVPASWFTVLKDYQKSRILNFISATKDPQGSGYNSIQSKITIGSGKMFGKGFREGTQAQLHFLPERHTDFAFSVFSEEHGFLGVLLMTICFFALFYKILEIAKQSREKVGFYLCIGCLAILFWHVTINLGMITGLLPVVGVPLPFFSYGGSHMMTLFITLGLISSVSSRRYVYSS